MSLTSAMNSAMSGLSAVSRATGLVASNIANAATPGYGRRTLALTANGQGIAGVNVQGVVRHADPALTAQRRIADASLAQTDIRAGFLERTAQSFGQPGDTGGLQAKLSGLESSLIAAASRPDLNGRLNDAVAQADGFAAGLRAASADLQKQRQQADQAIAGLVNDLNASLASLKKINGQVTATLSSGHEVSGLLDQRQQLLDQVNRIVPVTVVERDHGQIALYTNGGAVLLDGSAAQLGFTPSGTIQAFMTLAAGDLGGLSLNGIDLSTNSQTGALGGGMLGAQFALRDEWAVQAQDELDILARDLMERFEDPAADPTRAPGTPGLFTDDGATFDPSFTTGLAARISLNALVDPAQGGDSWRLRDGLGAAVAGDPGYAGGLHALTDALTRPRTLSGTPLGTGQHTAQTALSDIVSQRQSALGTIEREKTAASAVQRELYQMELARGVDTDEELQMLMTLEQNFSANAKVLETVDNLLAEILRI